MGENVKTYILMTFDLDNAPTDIKSKVFVSDLYPILALTINPLGITELEKNGRHIYIHTYIHTDRAMEPIIL